MQDLQTIGVENGALVVSSDDGTRFRLPIDEALHSRLRQNVPDPSTARKVAPKDVQAHIRSGMSAQDVASITGAPLDYIQRFEGPVIAEREFVVQSALAVLVHAASDPDPMRQGTSFGSVIRERLHAVGGVGERWASWKDLTSGWIVKLSFTANQIDHDARWQFDPKKHSLTPLNNEATTLSQQGESANALMPRLRAVGPDPTSPDSASPHSASPDATNPDSSRFDSGAFAFDELTVAEASVASVAFAPKTIGSGQRDAHPDSNQTADLLDALRRRRGEREAASFDDEDDLVGQIPGIRIVDVNLDVFPDEAATPQRKTAPQPVLRKKGRAAMPSWDEIVFGARPDDDLT